MHSKYMYLYNVMLYQACGRTIMLGGGIQNENKGLRMSLDFGAVHVCIRVA